MIDESHSSRASGEITVESSVQVTNNMNWFVVSNDAIQGPRQVAEERGVTAFETGRTIATTEVKGFTATRAQTRSNVLVLICWSIIER